MYEAEREILLNFGFVSDKITSIKDVVVFTVDQGRLLALKNIAVSPKRAKFIFSAKEHFYNNGFTNIDRGICTLKGEPFYVTDNRTFMLCDMPLGRKCNFDNNGEFLFSFETLAFFHKAATGFVPPIGSIERNKLGELPRRLEKRSQALKGFIEIAKRRKNRFDILFLNNVYSFYDDGIESLEEINKVYNAVANKAKEQRQLCHYNYFHENILLSNNKEMYVINFEKICFDSKVYDIANAIRKKMRRCNWDFITAVEAIERYNAVNLLEGTEIRLLFALLLFPQKFWRVSNQYYKNAGRFHYEENEHISKMYEVIEEKNHQKIFIDNFRRVL